MLQCWIMYNARSNRRKRGGGEMQKNKEMKRKVQGIDP